MFSVTSPLKYCSQKHHGLKSDLYQQSGLKETNMYKLYDVVDW